MNVRAIFVRYCVGIIAPNFGLQETYCGDIDQYKRF